MPQLLFQKEGETSRLIRSLFERVRLGYLLGRDDPTHYEHRWKRVIDELQEMFDDTGNFAALVKNKLKERDLFSDEAAAPQSNTAKEIYRAIKNLRYDKISKDPFIEKFGDDVVDTLLEKVNVFVYFVHWALRRDDQPLDPNQYESQKSLSTEAAVS